jgi:argininosuccinate lyase
MRVWDKGYSVEKEMIEFTVGDDYLLDQELVPFDCIASKAHAKMLFKAQVINEDELSSINEGLDQIVSLWEHGDFLIEQADEDCHTAIENYLIDHCEVAGKKIHTGRSRNDQVLAALRLYEKDHLIKIVGKISELQQALEKKAHEYKDTSLPGYTHMRKAMPSSVSMWLGSFVESLADDMKCFKSTLSLIDQNPLGTAAGFGVPVLEVDRDLTTRELEFAKKIENPMYAQLSRGKFEGNILNTCSQVMLTLNKLSTDIILFSMTEFGFINLPTSHCTGSSIMPQKLNPDVLELVRGKYHEVLGDEFKVKGLIGNLMSGYNRDVQLSKGAVIKSFSTVLSSLSILSSFIEHISFDKAKCGDAMSAELYATEEANKMVASGVPFRDAYLEIGKKFT